MKMDKRDYFDVLKNTTGVLKQWMFREHTRSEVKI